MLIHLWKLYVYSKYATCSIRYLVLPMYAYRHLNREIPVLKMYSKILLIWDFSVKASNLK